MREGASRWLPYLDLACVVVAGAWWYAFPRAHAWPLLVALAPWAVRWVLTGSLTHRTACDLPLALFLASAAVAVWASFDRQAAISKFWLIVGAALVYYALANARNLEEARVWLLALFGAGVSAYFVATHDWEAYPAKVELFTHLGRSLQAALPSLPGHRLHPNVAGGIVAMMAPFSGLAVWSSWKPERHRGIVGSGVAMRRGWPVQVLACFLLGLTLFGLAMSTSRGAWVALGTAVLAAALLAFARAGDNEKPAWRLWLLAAVSALVVVTGLVVVVAFPETAARLLVKLPGPDTGLSRLDLLRTSGTLARDYPIVGAGLGSFQMLYSTYVLLLHVGFTVHSHNLLLDVAVEQALPAVLALVWMWIATAAAAWRGTRGPGAQTRAPALIAAAMCLTLLLVPGLVDDVLYGSRAVLLLFVPLAFGSSGASREKRAVERAVLPVALLLLLAVALVWRRPLLSRVYSNLGAVHQSKAELSAYRWPDYPVQDAVRRSVSLDLPVAELRQSLALDPGNATANRRLGMIELSLGSYEQALIHLETAYEAEPGSDTTRQLLGEAYLANGRLEQGQELWGTLPNAQGQLAARVFWYEYIGDAQRAEWMAAAVDR